MEFRRDDKKPEKRYETEDKRADIKYERREGRRDEIKVDKIYIPCLIFSLFNIAIFLLVFQLFKFLLIIQ